MKERMGGCSKNRGGKNRVSGEGEGEEGAEVVEPSNKLPKAKVVRVMRRVLPQNVRIGESTKQLTHDCVVEFVRYVGGEAAERARSEYRRTIAPEHFTRSFHGIGFDSYVDPMRTYIQGHREYYDNACGGRSSGLPRAVPAPVYTLSPDAPVTVTDEELEFLQSIIPPPLCGY